MPSPYFFGGGGLITGCKKWLFFCPRYVSYSGVSLGDFFTDCTMVNHHQTTIWENLGEYGYTFSKHPVEENQQVQELG